MQPINGQKPDFAADPQAIQAATQKRLASVKRAQKINKAMIDVVFYTEAAPEDKTRINDAIEVLKGATLLEMAWAGPTIQQHEETRVRLATDPPQAVDVVCDPRIVAAIYAMIHFNPDRDGGPKLLMMNGKKALILTSIREVPDDETAGEA